MKNKQPSKELIMNSIFIALILFGSMSHAQNTPTNGQKSCAFQYHPCKVKGSQVIRFQSNADPTKFVDKTFTADFNCDVPSFPSDPDPKSRKFCYTQPPVVATPSPTPVPQASYEVYKGCPSPDSTFTRTVTIDPSKGETLAGFFTAKKINAGDHVILLAGDHGAVYAKYLMVPADKWTWLDFKQGATVQGIQLKSMSKFLVTNATSTAALSASGGSSVIIADSTVKGVDAKTATVAQWLAAPGGISFDDTRCNSVLRNKVYGTRFAITQGVRGEVVGDPASTSMKSVWRGNLVDGNSADFFRPIGSDVIFDDNTALNGMVTANDGDANHDDFFQIFTGTPGVVFENIEVKNNYFQESNIPGRKLVGEYQGFNSFGNKGILKNLVVTGNTVLSSAYQQMNFTSVQGGLVEHNTTLVIFADQSRSNHFQVEGDSKTIVRNNVGCAFMLAGTTATNNIGVCKGATSAAVMKFDLVNQAFDVTPKPGGVLDKKGAGSKF